MTYATKTLAFWGESDDLPYYSETTGTDQEVEELYGDNRTFRVETTENVGLLVTLSYATHDQQDTPHRPGVWIVGISPLDEGISIPDWPISMSTAENGYSAILSIEVPVQAKVTWGEDDE